MAIYHPPTFINAYLKANIVPFADGEEIPFFPTSPTAIEDLTETFPQNNIFAVYDRMLKMRKSPFPHIKSEQLMYYFYAKGDNPVDRVIETTQQVQDLLDREDESAQELNNWIKGLPDGDPVYVKEFDSPRPTKRLYGQDTLIPFFHRLRIYQLQETRDIIDFGTARTYAGNKIIIDYDWHKS